jgi:hypothetical protein
MPVQAEDELRAHLLQQPRNRGRYGDLCHVKCLRVSLKSIRNEAASKSINNRLRTKTEP